MISIIGFLMVGFRREGPWQLRQHRILPDGTRIPPATLVGLAVFRDELAGWPPDPMSAEEREEWLDRLCQSGDPPGDEDDEDRDFEPLTAEELAEIRAAAADEALAAEAAMTGRRGPGMAGSARVFPGESASPAASFGPGMALDVTPGCAGLALAADAAAGEDDSFAGVSDAELLGVLCAWDRVEAHAAAR
jgi:hypothetical protein